MTTYVITSNSSVASKLGHRRRLVAVAAALPACALVTAVAVCVAGAPGSVAAGRGAERPPAHFWRTASQAIAIADRQPMVKLQRARYPGVRGRATAAALGLWEVDYQRSGGPSVMVQIEDRSGEALQVSNWSWPLLEAKIDASKIRVELILAGLGALFLLTFFDWRRPLQIGNLDLLALLAFGASFAFFDRGQPLTAVPLAYPPLLYLLARLLLVGFRGARASRPLVTWASERMLLVALAAVVAVRIALNLTIGYTNDVAYASVLGANSIHHGWPVYVPGNNHLDTYGPISYLAYLPFELLFPMNANWLHDSLPAAHAATITFDLLTMAGLWLLGRRLAARAAGRRLGVLLALGWAVYPFGFFPYLLNTNDALIPLFVVYALLALSSPAVRGVVLGLAAAAKFAPLALAGLLAAGRGQRRPSALAAFAVALGAVISISIWMLLPTGDLHLFWQKTIAFQLQRQSLSSIWGQQPELRWLQTAVKAATVALAALAFVYPRRRDTIQVAALAGAILVGLELSMTHWSEQYVAWFAPLAIVCLCAAPEAVRTESRKMQLHRA
jgi:hypothetical protein